MWLSCIQRSLLRSFSPIRYRNRAQITVLMCEQKPYPVWFSCMRKTYLVECEHSLRLFSWQVHLLTLHSASCAIFIQASFDLNWNFATKCLTFGRVAQLTNMISSLHVKSRNYFGRLNTLSYTCHYNITWVNLFQSWCNTRDYPSSSHEPVWKGEIESLFCIFCLIFNDDKFSNWIETCWFRADDLTVR